MPNPVKDWARMYGAHTQYLESQGRPSSTFGQRHDRGRLAGRVVHEHVAVAEDVGMTIDWIRRGQLSG
ncbi:hypothetical protein Mycsm_03027 [Mycobacterium sp. JS623]|uniref:hypothetical protein n=1 Tax=Mycobacterium sp. JS623 TaxID=212767 RepID=UPI0002A5A0C1|nr:hypothetical protein [Mycobacterium sp. JS623]AGB23348.1 hypothetical protein Mycsm_03027 [Mycobacterium sp. JS623]